MTVHTAHEIARIRDLRVEVDGRALVDGVSLGLAPGRITALIGASGSGKTTTGRALLHAYPPGATVTGEVSVPDTPVGYVPQHPATALNPARPVAALLQDIARAQVRHLPRRARRPALRHRVLDALARAQLPDGEVLLKRYPHQLSGGQQQRVVLAQALLAGATVIVADEPTTGQDALTKREITGRLAAVARQGIAVLLLSHDLDVVRALADEVHVLHAGRLVESGPPELLRHAAQHPRTRALLTAADPTAAADPPAPSSALPAPSSARPAPDTVLHVRGLTARHGSSRVLHVPELRLAPGCLAVVGRSGSGKTTLGRCLAGLHRTHDGQLRLDGAALPRSLRDRTRAQLAAVQYVFQDAHASFDTHRTILDQVARSAVRLRHRPRAEATADAVRTLRSLGLTGDLPHRTPAELSGGELQRAALARALLARPRVLICDEIASGLDPVTRGSLLTLLEGLLRADPDLCLVLITHDRDTAALATTLAVLDAGRLVEHGPAARLRTAPRHPLTAGLLQVPGPAPQPSPVGPDPHR
ncbi:ABC transporter ATP-binding protein [Streptomyces sp. NBRC 13847]|uniref:ABC transporter ATP-binding protein n=1 Tax=Streptomyces TaxID=1883 RepID=UPI0024A4770E|nr:ATP-binding cassette domain-containing protein [Streptomyces sp. NBRC 13847]GLW14411.1 ABC transporter ATP-binding protein [Streptomyces sp. NBRC 13847]